MLKNVLLKKRIGAKRAIFFSLCLMVFFLSLGTTTPTVIMTVVTILLWVFSGEFIKSKQRWLHRNWSLPVVFFIVMPWVALLWSDNVKEGLSIASKGYYWLLPFVIASIELDEKDVDIFFACFFVGLSLFGFFSIMTFFHSAIPSFVPTIDSKKYIVHSLLLVFGMSVLSFYFRKSNRLWIKVLTAVLLFVFLFVLSIGQGRSGYLAFLVLSPVIFYNLSGGRLALLGILVGIVAIGIMFQSPVVQNRINEVFRDIKTYQEGNPNTSVGLRLNMWQGAVKIFIENPVIGIGTGGFPKAMSPYNHPNLLPEFKTIAHPHNNFLFMAVHYGLIGLGLIMWLFVVYFKKGWALKNSLAGFAIISYGVVVFVGGLTDTQILSMATGRMFALFMGLEKH